MIDAFKNAPIWNPDGTMGVDLHLVSDDVIPGLGDFNYEAFLSYVKEHKDYGSAYYYALLVNDLGDYMGLAFTSIPRFALDQEPSFLESARSRTRAGS